MKKFILLIAVSVALFSFNTLSSAQNLSLASKIGYARIDHKRANYSKANCLPLNISLGFGLENFQIGGDLILSSILPETHFFYDELTSEKRVREEVGATYIGGFLSYSTSPDPSSITGLIIKIGAGLLNSKKTVYALPSEVVNARMKYEPALQYLGEIGVSIPFGGIFYIYVGTGVTYTRKEMIQNEVQTEYFGQLKYIGQFGLNVQLDFAN